MDNITLYSTGCPRCSVLESKLNQKNIKYNIVDSVEEMTSLGIEFVPVLYVNDKRMDFKEAIEWVNSMEG